MHSCASIVVVRRIITSIQLDGAPLYASQPPPPGEFYTIHAVKDWFGVTSKTIRNVLAEHRGDFDQPQYDRMRRLLSPRDLDVLKAIFTISVKRKVPVPPRPDTSRAKAC